VKTILELNNTEAKQYFLKQESYCNVQLPEYFNFQPLLDALAKNGSLKDGIQLDKAKKLDDVNYQFLTNKDGKFAWRLLQLINPVIYVFLVNKITEERHWKLIVNRFEKFKENNQIKCCSIPVVSSNPKEKDKQKTITNWWQQTEQQSLELALRFDCLLNTDITDCYSSIYTHSIPWALHGKKVIKKNFRLDKKHRINYLGDDIDCIIQSMQYSQTNGIPQGSVLMDFVAEMVLGYADRIISCKIKQYNHKNRNHGIDDFQILRYRDDYRIFANNQETLVKIAKLLTETLIELNLKLNIQKTFISDNIVRDTIKPDKLYWNSAKQGEKTLQKHLFLIHSLAEKHTNSGSLSKALDSFLNRVYPLKLFKEENTKVLVSILVDIAYNNPRTYPIIIGILSKIISLEVNKVIVEEILTSIEKKFDKIPNVGHLQIWLQRLTLKTEYQKDYTEPLCKKVTDNTVQLWNINWVTVKVKNDFTNRPIIDEQKKEDMPQIIEPKEIKTYNNY